MMFFGAGLSSEHSPSEQPSNRPTEHQIVAANLDIAWRYSDGRMAVCPVGPMNDAPMISAMHKDCALPFAVRAVIRSFSIRTTEQPNNRASEWGPMGVFAWREQMVGWLSARLIR
jgi:hypothetical protein